MKPFRALFLVGFLPFAAPSQADTVTPPTGSDVCLLSSLDLTAVTYFDDSGKNGVQADKATYGGDLLVRGTTYASGVGTHAPSQFVVKVNGATEFHALFAIDDAANHGAGAGRKSFRAVCLEDAFCRPRYGGVGKSLGRGGVAHAGGQAKELAGVGRERGDIAAHPFCMESGEGEGAFAAARYAGHHDKTPGRHAKMRYAQIVRACAAKCDCPVVGNGNLLFHFREK